MPATSKQDLLEVTTKEFAKLQALIQPLNATQAALAEEGVSIKDVIGHRAHWIELFLGWYADGQAGKAVYFPAEGYKWNDLKRYNADLRARQAELDWADVQEMLQSNHDQLLGFLQGLSDERLYGGPMKGANNAWTPGRWAEAAGASHYRSASKFIRKVLRANA